VEGGWKYKLGGKNEEITTSCGKPEKEEEKEKNADET